MVMRTKPCAELAAPAMAKNGFIAIAPKLLPMKPKSAMLIAISGTNCHRLSSGWKATITCTALTTIKANSAVWLTRRAPKRSTMRALDQLANAIDPAQIANTIGKMSPAPKVWVISCFEEMMKPNRALNTSAEPST